MFVWFKQKNCSRQNKDTKNHVLINKLMLIGDELVQLKTKTKNNVWWTNNFTSLTINET